MKKKGFTLIELLAVIVVLAIIALIATPIVMNLIKNAGKGAAERSGERYLKAVETMIATERAKDGTIVEDGTYTIGDGKISKDGKEYTIEVTGDYPKEGSIVIANGQVVSSGTSMTIGDYTVTINDKGSATATAKGDIVALCTAAAPSTQNVPKYSNSKWTVTTPTVGVQATSADPYALGSVYTCDLGDGARTFYVLGTEGDNVKLILNENLSSTVAWAESGDNSEGPVTANAALAERTSGWTKLTQSQITLPDAQDIADAMGDTEWNDANNTGTAGPDWMITNLGAGTAPYGYWTSTPFSNPSSIAWNVYLDGVLSGFLVHIDGSYGVRPVITISKSSLLL